MTITTPIHPYIIMANDWLAATVPLDVRITIALIALIFAMIINRKAGYGMIGIGILTIILYGFMRWLGLGG